MKNTEVTRAEPAGARGRSGRDMALRGLRVVVPVVLLVLIWRSVAGEEALGRMTAADPAWVVAALLAAQVQVVASAMRWRLTAARLGLPIGARRAVGEYYLSGLVNMTLPGGVAGDAARVFRSRGAKGVEVAAQSVVIERFAGQVALAAALLAGVLLFSGAEARLLIGGAVAALAIAVVRGRKRLARPVATRAAGPLSRFLAALITAWSSPGAFWRQAALSLGIVGANLATFAFAAAATGTPLGLSDTLLAVPPILAAMLVPFSVGGWGYREGAAAAIFPLIGASASAGLAASTLFGLIVLAANLPGLAVLLLRRAPPAAAAPGHSDPLALAPVAHRDGTPR